VTETWVPVRSEIEVELPTLQSKIADLQVVSPATHAEAGTLLQYIGTKRAIWAAHMDPHIQGAKDAKRVADQNRSRLVDEKDRFDRPLAEAERTLAGRILAYEQRLETERKAEEARLQAEVDAQAAEHAFQEALCIENEALAAPGYEAAGLLQEAAQRLEDVSGGTVRLGRPVPKVKGLAPRVTWEAEVYDLKALLLALVGASPYPSKMADHVLERELVERIKEAVLVPLNKRAVASQDALRVPGVRAVRVDLYQLRRR
jgi:hypothetical protein